MAYFTRQHSATKLSRTPGARAAKPLEPDKKSGSQVEKPAQQIFVAREAYGAAHRLKSVLRALAGSLLAQSFPRLFSKSCPTRRSFAGRPESLCYPEG
jgi:hypothetical protein